LINMKNILLRVAVQIRWFLKSSMFNTPTFVLLFLWWIAATTDQC
jgi:hypothetical protein